LTLDFPQSDSHTQHRKPLSLFFLIWPDSQNICGVR
jgi:hypothetical protein